MSHVFEVQAAQIRKTKAGKDYLALTIDGNTVSFFNHPDVSVPVKPGDLIACDIKSSGRFWNGSSLSIVTDPARPRSPFPSVEAAQPDSTASFSKTIKGGSRTYIVEVKQAKNGEHFLSLVELGGQGPNHRIIVFKDHVAEFASAVSEASKHVG